MDIKNLKNYVVSYQVLPQPSSSSPASRRKAHFLEGFSASSAYLCGVVEACLDNNRAIRLL